MGRFLYQLGLICLFEKRWTRLLPQSEDVYDNHYKLEVSRAATSERGLWERPVN